MSSDSLSLVSSAVASPAVPVESDVIQINLAPEVPHYRNLEKFLERHMSVRFPAEVREAAKDAIGALREGSRSLPGLIRHLFLELSLKGTFLESKMWYEVSSSLENLEGPDFLERLELFAKHEDDLRNGIIGIRDIERGLRIIAADDVAEASKSCDGCFRATIRLVTDGRGTLKPIAPTRLSLWTGRVSSCLSRIDRLFAERFGQPSHQYCGCHALAARVRLPGLAKELIPLSPPRMGLPLADETVAIFGCEWGAGHKMPAQGIAELCRDHLGACVYTFNLPDDVLPPSEDAVYNSPLKKLGYKSVTEFFNALMQENAFAIVNWTQSGAAQPDPQGQARRVLFIIQRLLETKATFAVTTYSKHNEELIIACRHLGLPLIHIATDIKNFITTREAPPQTKNFVMAMPVELPRATEWGKVKEEQLLVTGPFVRTPFRKARSDADIPVLRQKWDMPEGKKLLVFSDSGNGASLAFIEQIQERYEDGVCPYHCVVLCRGNDALVKRVRELNLPYVRAERFANADQMEELLTMAAYGGAVVTKPGGSTVFECLRRGTRMLTPNMPSPVFGSGAKHALFGMLNKLAAWNGCATQLPWERMNFDYMVGRHQAAEFSAAEQFLEALTGLTDGVDRPVKHDDLPHFEEQILRLIPNMLLAARDDDEVMRSKAKIEEIE